MLVLFRVGKSENARAERKRGGRGGLRTDTRPDGRRLGRIRSVVGGNAVAGSLKEMPILWLGHVVETSCGRAAPVLILFRVGRGLGGCMGKSEDACAERKRGGRGPAVDQHPG